MENQRVTIPYALEHHTFEPTCTPIGVDLVMLHGICAGAWVFPEHFIQPFLNVGLRVHTLSYRGHGASEGKGSIRHFRLADYVEDVISILETLEKPPLLLGHSLGTAVAQRLLRDRYPLAGLCLMSPVPPRGLGQISMRMLWSDPIAYQQLVVLMTMGVKQVSERVGARLLFSKESADPEIRAFFSHCDDESPWLAMDLQGFPRIGPIQYDPGQDPPVTVFSGAEDRMIRPADASEAARFYQTDLQLIAGGSHMLMFDADAEITAQRIADRLVAMTVAN